MAAAARTLALESASSASGIEASRLVSIFGGGRSSVVLSTGVELAVSRRCGAGVKGLIGGRV